MMLSPGLAELSQKFVEATAVMHRSFHSVARADRSLLMLPEEICFQVQEVLGAKLSPTASPALQDTQQPTTSSATEQRTSTAGGGKHGNHNTIAAPASVSPGVAALTALNLMPKRPASASRQQGSSPCSPCSEQALLLLTDLVAELLSEDAAR